MCRLFETIRVVDGVPLNLEYHRRRVERSRKELFGIREPLDFTPLLPPVPSAKGIFRWRVIYDRVIHETTLEPYLPKKVRSLQMVRNDGADYPFKYLDRKVINDMFDQKGSCDDILIIRNGLVTDTSYGNIVFLYGKSWVTPRNPLLPGTCRDRLLETGLICEAEIEATDLHMFRSASIINAMLEPGGMVIKMKDIIPATLNR